MNSTDQTNALFSRRLDRRSFLHKAGLIAAMTPAAAMLLGGNNEVEADALPFAPGTELDIAILNFALNLEYLEGEYYNFGAFGKSLTDQGVTVSGPLGVQGTVKVKDSPKVTFSSDAMGTLMQQYAEEIALDEVAHIKFLQQAITELGGSYVAEPDINLVDSFNIISDNAGLGSTFDPYASQTNFFLGGFSLTDVGVTAYHGAAGLLTLPLVITSAAGILGTEAYHDAVLRQGVYLAGSDAIAMASAISALRAKLDNNSTYVRDQGVVDSSGAYNLTPVDDNSIVFARHPGNVLNIVCGGGHKVRKGGFFPSSVNGPIY